MHVLNAWGSVYFGKTETEKGRTSERWKQREIERGGNRERSTEMLTHKYTR
jgi:hypothetical protein